MSIIREDGLMPEEELWLDEFFLMHEKEIELGPSETKELRMEDSLEQKLSEKDERSQESFSDEDEMAKKMIELSPKSVSEKQSEQHERYSLRKKASVSYKETRKYCKKDNSKDNPDKFP
jgi:hypothetical protein